MKTSRHIEYKLIRWYLVLDFLSGITAYGILHVVRKLIIEPKAFGVQTEIKVDLHVVLAALSTATVYMLISALGGVYRNLTRKSRLKQASNTFTAVLFTSVLLFFAIFLDDFIKSYKQYYLTIGTYFSSLLLFSGLSRFSIATWVRKQLDERKLQFRTLLVGGGKEAGELYETFQKERTKGYQFLGCMKIDDEPVDQRLASLPQLGSSKSIKDVATDNHIEDVIIALKSGKSEIIAKIVSDLEELPVRIHVLPNLFSILSGQVKMDSFGRSLIEVKRELVPPHVVFLKRSFDIVFAIIALFFSGPIILFAMMMVKKSSPGPLFYKQERLGKNGLPFHILKLRSMYIDSEKQGPQLSSEDDPRITPWGRTMRKYRIDELPQFINVLFGDMSIVGPRPERAFYFNQIISEAPQYKFLLRVKPGITSWGMVKYGYAENVSEMLERARYDLIYTENITLLSDIKILFYTLVTVIQGRGK